MKCKEKQGNARNPKSKFEMQVFFCIKIQKTLGKSAPPEAKSFALFSML